MSNTPSNDDDDFELELEPVDPEILALERRRAEQKTEEAVAKVDFEDEYRRQDLEGLSIDWEGWKQFRFSTRHLLIVTAVLAVLMTLFKVVENPCSGIAILSVVLLAGGWYWVWRVERRREAERARQRAEFFGSGGKAGEPAFAADDAAAPRRASFKFAFSMQQMLGAITAAAVVLGLSTAMGLDNMALILGGIALAGLAAYMLFEPPPILVLAWWILLVMYLIVGVFAAVAPRDSAVRGMPDGTYFDTSIG